MERSPLYLAAIASTAVPGLDPVTVEALPSLPQDRFDVAFVRDTEHRRWVVRAPRTVTAGADLENAIALVGLLGRRVSFSVPSPKGFFQLGEEGRAAIYPYLPGDPIDFAEIPEGASLAGDIGRILAAIHNLDLQVAEEAGLASYDADTYRNRRLAELDRAASTGRIPTTLLSRWEQALEDVSLWRFAPATVHGRMDGENLLVTLDNDGAGKVRAVVGWEAARVADPADDFATLVELAQPAVLDRVLEAYAHARLERPDPHLLVRARLASELDLVRQLMDALARKDGAAVDGLSSRLRRLDELVHSLEEHSDDYQRMSLSAVGVRTAPAPPPTLEDTEEDEELPAVEATEHATRGQDDAEAAEVDRSQHPADDEQVGDAVVDAEVDTDEADRELEVEVAGEHGRAAAAQPTERAPSTRAETVEISLDPPS